MDDPSSYSLGIDVGTTFTAAAISRAGVIEVVALGTHQLTAPTVMFAAGDDVSFGSAALLRGQAEPAGMAREFKRRVGDSVPLVLSGTPYAADRLVALYARWVVDTVSEQLGAPPRSLVMTHPANWTEFQLNLLQHAFADVGLESAAFLSEPAAAALDYAAVADVQPGETYVVYDLGGGTFDAALLRRGRDGFVQLGDAAGLERLGGIDFDEAVFHHVVDALPEGVMERVRHDPDSARALAQLRRSCIEAKEGLSSETAVEVAVVLPELSTTVRLTRDEFESMIRPALSPTVELVRRMLDGAGVAPDDVTAALLVGGSSRIPIVSEVVRDGLGLPTRVDAHPKLVVARGAARRAAAVAGPIGVAPGQRSRSPRLVIAGAALAALVLGGAGVIAATAGGDDGATATTEAAGPSTETAPAAQTVAPTTVVPTVQGTSAVTTAPPSAPGTAVSGSAPVSTPPTSASPGATTLPDLPAGTKWAELSSAGVRFAVPTDWVPVEPDADVQTDPGAFDRMAERTGLPADVLRDVVGTALVPHVLDDAPAASHFWPNLVVHTGLAELPTMNDFLAAIAQDAGSDAVVVPGSTIDDGGGSMFVRYSFTVPEVEQPVQGYGLAFDRNDRVVVILLKTLDADATSTMGRDIAATLTPLQ